MTLASKITMVRVAMIPAYMATMYLSAGQAGLWMYLSLAISMIAGRLIRTLAETVFLNIRGNTFVLSTFFTGTILAGIPGIILQFIIIPATILLLNKLNFQKSHDTHKNIK